MSEAQEQINLFLWIGWMTPKEPRLAFAFHVPNGGKRDKATAGKMKALGVKKGVPDILLPIPSRGHVGFAAELKIKGGRPTPEQVVWIRHLCSAGWYASDFIGWHAVAKALCWYLERDDLGFGRGGG